MAQGGGDALVTKNTVEYGFLIARQDIKWSYIVWTFANLERLKEIGDYAIAGFVPLVHLIHFFEVT